MLKPAVDTASTPWRQPNRSSLQRRDRQQSWRDQSTVLEPRNLTLVDPNDAGHGFHVLPHLACILRSDCTTNMVRSLDVMSPSAA